MVVNAYPDSAMYTYILDMIIDTYPDIGRGEGGSLDMIMNTYPDSGMDAQCRPCCDI